MKSSIITEFSSIPNNFPFLSSCTVGSKATASTESMHGICIFELKLFCFRHSKATSETELTSNNWVSLVLMFDLNPFLW